MDAESQKAQATHVYEKPLSAGNGSLSGGITIDLKADKKLLRRIDWRVMPVLCFTYALQYYDKALLSQAAIFGMRADLDMMSGLRYSWASLIFYFGYMAGTYPVSLLAQKFPTRWVITAICILWGVVVLTTPACKTFEHFLVNRFFLGLIEAGVSPMFMMIVGLWYTHAEQVSRSSWWYSFSGGSLLVSPLINYGLGHVRGGSLQPWQYMYIIAGAATLVWGVALWWLFPDTPQLAKGFSDEERQMIQERLWEALGDYKLWGICILSIVSCTGSGAVTTFAPIVFNGMGFTIFQSLLLNLPIGALAFFCILGSGYLGRRLPNARLHIVSAACLPVILGCCLLWQLDSSARAGRIVGFYLLNFFSSAWTQCIGLGTSNVAGHTKKALYAAATFFAYSVGNIIGPLMFDASYAPRYDRSFIGILICFVVCFVASETLRFLLVRENRKREEHYGPADFSQGLDDLTDKENKSFRYHV
ncbi:allantoate permease [Ilyonectria robusta]